MLPAALARRLLLHGCPLPDATTDLTQPSGTAESAPTSTAPAGTNPARVFLTRLFTTPDQRDLLALDATARLFPPALRAALIIRDDHCRTPYCHAAIRHADHITPAAQSGPTTLINGQGLSARCNYTKELPGFTTRVLSRPEIQAYAASGTGRNAHIAATAGPGTHVTELTTPTGHRYLSAAPPLLD